MNKKAFNVFLTGVFIFSTFLTTSVSSVMASDDSSVKFIEESFPVYEDEEDFEVIDVAVSQDGNTVAALVYADSNYYAVVTESGDEFGYGTELNISGTELPCDIEVNNDGKFFVSNEINDIWFNSKNVSLITDAVCIYSMDVYDNNLYVAYASAGLNKLNIYKNLTVESVKTISLPNSCSITSLSVWKNYVVCGLTNGKLCGANVVSDTIADVIETGLIANVSTYPVFMDNDATTTVIAYSINNGVQLYYATCSTLTGLPSVIPTSNLINMAGDSAKTGIDYLAGSFYVVNNIKVDSNSINAVNRLTVNANWNLLSPNELNKLEIIANESFYAGFGKIAEHESIVCTDVKASNRRIYALVNDYHGTSTKRLYSCLNIQNTISAVTYIAGNLSTDNTWTGSALKWTSVENASSYKVQITTEQGDYSSAKALTLTNDGVTVGNSIILPKLQSKTKYYYRVCVNEPMATDWFEGSFTIDDITKISTPTLIYPVTNSYDVPISKKSVTLSWSDCTYANYYAVYIDETKDKVEKGTVTPTVVAATSAVISNLDYYTTYYWKVVAFRSTTNTYSSSLPQNSSVVGKFTTGLSDATVTTTTSKDDDVTLIIDTKTITITNTEIKTVTETISVSVPVTITAISNATESIINNNTVTQIITSTIDHTTTVTSNSGFDFDNFIDFNAYTDEQWLFVAIVGGLLIFLLFALIVSISRPRG